MRAALFLFLIFVTESCGMCGIVLSLMRRQAFCDELLLPTKFCCITSGSHRECQIAIFTNAVVVGVDGEVICTHDAFLF